LINAVVLVGRLTKDPEVQHTNSNIAVCKFTLAVNRKYKSDGGENEADFIRCVAWRKSAENMARFVKKGSLLGIEGRIETGSYDDKEGIRRYTTDVITDSVQFLEPKSQNNAPQNNGYTRQDSTPTIDVEEDDLPF
jgi:single-strand DNA-binding protein